MRTSVFVVALAFLHSGCLLVRTSEHQIKLHEDGSGEALLRLIDIRSDGGTDSVVATDFRELMSEYRADTSRSFEKNGRKVTTKNLLTSGDTLIGEIAYTFPDLEAVDGLRPTKNHLIVIVGPENEIVRTNGKVESLTKGSVRIVWDRDEKQLMYIVRERELAPSTSLALLYRETQR